MGCCKSKNDRNNRKNLHGDSDGDYVDKSRAIRGDTEARANKSVYKGSAWDKVDPLNAPYPDGQTDLNSIVNPDELRNKEATIHPENEMFPTRQVGKWVNVPVK